MDTIEPAVINVIKSEVEADKHHLKVKNLLRDKRARLCLFPPGPPELILVKVLAVPEEITEDNFSVHSCCLFQ